MKGIRIILLSWWLVSGCVGWGHQYRIINDEDSLDQVTSLLVAEGIGRSNVMAWAETVRQYNEYARQYAATVANTNWVNKVDKEILTKAPYPSDRNCRAGVFDLVKAVVTIGSNAIGENENAMGKRRSPHIDREIRRIYGLNPSECALYGVLFDSVMLPPVQQVTRTHAEEAMKQLKALWRTDGLRFPDNALRILQVILISREGANSDHAGLVILKNNKILLLEKVCPFAPYMLSSFSSIDEMGASLCRDYDEKKSPVVVILNDEIVATNIKEP